VEKAALMSDDDRRRTRNEAVPDRTDASTRPAETRAVGKHTLVDRLVQPMPAPPATGVPVPTARAPAQDGPASSGGWIQRLFGRPSVTDQAHTEASEARMWRVLGASRAPASAGDAAQAAVDGKGTGHAVDPGIAAAVGAHTGTNLADVRVHQDPLSQQSAHAMNARAFAHRSDVFLGPGESETDRALMAHELTHVAQQRGGAAIPQRKLAVGDSNSPAEAEADHVAQQVTSGSAPQEWLIDSGPVVPGQMLKSAFLEQLKPDVTNAANEELGRLGSALACPYIAEYFAKYGALPAGATSALIKKWIPGAVGATSAQALIPMIVQRVRAGVHVWKETGKLPADLAAAEPAAAQQAQQQATAAPQAHKKSLDAMETELGEGQAVDSKLAAPLGAEGARIHHGPIAERKAAERDAVAFAVGQNVVMGASAPKPGTLAGDALLAHELAHTAQQKTAAADPIARKKPIGDEDQGAERDADRAASGAMSSNEKLAKLSSFAGRIGDVVTTGLQLQRCATQPPSLDRYAYLREHEAQIAVDAANTLRTLPFGTMDASVTWAAGGREKFAGHLADQIAAPTTAATIESLVKPERITSLIDSARLMNEEGSAFGPDKYFGAVGIEVANALARRTTESLQREVPRFAQAKLHGSGHPKVEDLVVSHPIDPLVVRALTIEPVVNVQGGAFDTAHPNLTGAPKQINSTRNVVTEKVGESGMWFRLKEPMDATVEEIASALLGQPTEAYRITNAHPLYGVAKDASQNEFSDLSLADPARQLLTQDTMNADEAILSQAGAAKPTRPGARILEQMRVNSTLIGKTVYQHALRFGPDVAGRIVPAAQRIDERIAKLSTAKEADIQKWDAQTSQQNETINKAARGLQADLLRLQLYATQFDDSLKDDPGAHKLPHEHRLALHEDAELWCDALAISDMTASANAKLQQAVMHSATLETGVLERQLGTTQAAAFSAKDTDNAKRDFDASSLESRELAARQKLAVIRAQTISDPAALDDKANAKTSEDARDLVFESNVIQQASSLDQAWKALDDLDGTLSHLTGDHSDLSALKSEGKKYYAQWQAVFTLIKAGDPTSKTSARKQYEQLASDPKFQDYLERVRTLLQKVQKHHIIATIIATIVITVVTMGAGIVVEGLVGGATVAAEGGALAAEGLEVASGLGATARTARLAGAVANAATGALLQQIVFARNITVKGFFIDFARNLVLYGAMQGVAAGLKVAGLDKVVEAGFKQGASVADLMKGGSIVVGEAVLNGGIGVLEAIVEAKVKEKMGGKAMTEDEVKEMIIQTAVQTVVLAMTARLLKSPLNALKIKAAFQGDRWRHAYTANQHLLKVMEARAGGNVTSEEVVNLANQERAQIADEIAALEELKAQGDKALEGAGVDRKGIDAQIASLSAYEGKARGFAFAFGMKAGGADGYYEAPRAQMPDILRTQTPLAKEAPVVESRSPETGARTWLITPKDENTAPFRIKEEMPDWALTAEGKRLVQTAERANLDWVFGLPKDQLDAVLHYDHALTSNDPKAIDAAEHALSGIDKGHRDALVNAYKGLAQWRSAEQQETEVKTLKDGGKLDPAGREHLATELRRQVPDIGLVDAVRAGDAKTVLSVVVPGGGETGIKAMNDEMIGYGLNSSQLIPERNTIIKAAFERQGFHVIDQGYKMTTLVSNKPASETAPAIKAALAEVDLKMKPLLTRVLGEGIAHFQAEQQKLPPKDPNRALIDARIDKMTKLRAKIAANESYHFDFQLGAAEIKGGKNASYGDILAAEMDASKGAIMARDGAVAAGPTTGDARAIVYSQADFIAFCKDTIVIKDRLVGRQLPYDQHQVRVLDGNGNINHDLLRAIRKDSYKEPLTPEQQQTLDELKQYITRVNSFDYVKHFTGDEVRTQGAAVEETRALIKKLEGKESIDPDTVAKIDKILSGGIPQAGAASEAQFYNRAAKLSKRTVLNADIKDMGLDLFDGYARTMDAVGRGRAQNLDRASASASDGIVEYKRKAADEFARYYKDELLPKARENAKQLDRQDLVSALASEGEPTMLLGGDEITVSLSGAFEELGLLPEAVAKLTNPEVANARVAVTHTGAGDGMAEHDLAMQRASGGQDILKKRIEPLARKLDTAAKSLSGPDAATAKDLVAKMNGMYTVEQQGKDVVVDATGQPIDVEVVEVQAKKLIKTAGAKP
jgi:hypothetical protein